MYAAPSSNVTMYIQSALFWIRLPIAQLDLCFEHNKICFYSLIMNTSLLGLKKNIIFVIFMC